VGSSIAYHLAVVGVSTLLIEQKDLASGASGANFGLVQVEDAEFGLSLDLTLEGFGRFSTLEDQLDWDLDYRETGYLLLIENEAQLAAMRRRASRLQAAGVSVELLDQEEVCRLEPNLSAETVIGALYHADEGALNPFELVYAYARRGRDHGLDVWTQTTVKRLSSQGRRVTGVQTSNGPVMSEVVILATGAWTRSLLRTVGLEIPVLWVHGEALVTEPIAPMVRHAMTSAVFFEVTEGAKEQVVGFCLHQRSEGNVMIGEAALTTDQLGRRVTANSMPLIAREGVRYLPALDRASVIRSWAIPVAFAPDNQPFLGPVEGLQGLIVATGFKSTIVLTPLVGALVEGMITGDVQQPRLRAFSPSRPL